MNSYGLDDLDFEGYLLQFAPIRVAPRSTLLPRIGLDDLRLPPTLHVLQASSLLAPSLLSASTASTASISRPSTPLDSELLQGISSPDVQTERTERVERGPPYAPNIECIDLPDVGATEVFTIPDNAVVEYVDEYVDEEEDMTGSEYEQLDELDLRLNRVASWLDSERDTDGTYAKAVPQTFEEGWYGPLGGKTPKASRTGLPAPSVRVYQP